MTSFLAEDCNVISVDWRDLAGPAPWYDVIRQVRVNPKEKPYDYKACLMIIRLLFLVKVWCCRCKCQTCRSSNWRPAFVYDGKLWTIGLRCPRYRF